MRWLKFNYICGIFCFIGFLLMVLFQPVDWTKDFNEMNDEEIKKIGITDGFLFCSVIIITSTFFTSDYFSKIFKKLCGKVDD